VAKATESNIVSGMLMRGLVYGVRVLAMTPVKEEFAFQGCKPTLNTTNHQHYNELSAWEIHSVNEI